MLSNPCFVALATLVTSCDKGKSLCWRTAQSLPERQPCVRVLDLFSSQPESPALAAGPARAAGPPSRGPGTRQQLPWHNLATERQWGKSPLCQGGEGEGKNLLFSYCASSFGFLVGGIHLPAHLRRQLAPPCAAGSWAGFSPARLGGCQPLTASLFLPASKGRFSTAQRESKETRCSGQAETLRGQVSLVASGCCGPRRAVLDAGC